MRARRGVSLDTRRVADLNVHFVSAFLEWALRGSDVALRRLTQPILSGSFDRELPPAEHRPHWPCQQQLPEDTSSLGFALEHAPCGAAGPARPPAWLYAWEEVPGAD